MHFETHDTLIDGQRLHPEPNGYAKRLLTDLQALAFGPEWAEQTTSVEEDQEIGLDLRQFRVAFFTQKVAPCRVELSNGETTTWKTASGSALWQKIPDRWRARRAERETKTHQTAAWRVEGRRDDGEHELGAERERQGQTHRHEAAQCRPQDSVRPITTSLGSQRRSLHVLRRQQREKDTALDHQGLQRSRGSYKLCRREAARWERPTRQVWQASSKYGTIWSRRWHSTWYATASWPKFTSQLCAVSSSSSAWQSIENTLVGQSDEQERIIFSVKLQAERWNEHCLQRSSRV